MLAGMLPDQLAKLRAMTKSFTFFRARTSSRPHCSRIAQLRTNRIEAQMSHHNAGSVVVCGGGIIGVATAYYMSLQGVSPLLVEGTGIACAASGKAGGFLAQDWTDELARVSYGLHEQLARELPTDVGYRPVQSLAVAASAKGSARRRNAKVPTWLDGQVSGGQVLGTTQSTAQVHPEKLTKALMTAAEQNGAKVRLGRVEAVQVSNNHVTGVTVDGELVPATAVVLALGPWTSTLGAALQVPHIAGQLGHSLVLRPRRSEALPADCLFVSWQSKSGKASEPEIFPRADGTVWCCGENSMVTPPQNASQVQPRPGAAHAIQEVAAALSSDLASAEVLQSQACIRPLSPDGQPIIGQHPNIAGLYIATGHSCWGILNGPATGKAIAELITSGVSQCVDLSPYDPARFERPGKAVKQKAHVQQQERTHLAAREPVDPDTHFPEARHL